MTAEELWNPDESLGKPVRVGEWLYDGRISLAVRLFKSGTLWGSGDENDPPDVRDDQAIDCYYLELQVLGGHLKTGHRLTLQNRPTQPNQNKSIYTLREGIRANSFSGRRSLWVYTDLTWAEDTATQ
jgi:hypothetical protein